MATILQLLAADNTSVVQETNINTGVTCSGTVFSVTTVSLTTTFSVVAGTFVVTSEKYFDESQVIMVTATNGTNTGGIPYAYVSSRNTGSNQFSITVANIGVVTQGDFNGTLIISLIVAAKGELII